MGSYRLIKEHGIEAENAVTDFVSVSPHWILMVVRYSEPLTSSKARLAKRTAYNTGDVALDDDASMLNRVKAPLIITSSCTSMDISSSKGQYTQSLQAVLKPGSVNYLSAIMPGDWVFAWIMNTKEKYLEVLEKIRTESPANEWDDGLKFVGRVQDIRKILGQTPAGLKTLQYNLQCAGFGELDSHVFFDPHLSRNEKYIERYLQSMNISMNDIYTKAAEDSSEAGGIDINKVIPALVKAFLGEGLSGVGTASGGLQLSAGASIASEEAPFAYVIPDGIATLLGVKTPSKAGGMYSYADILEVIQGLQKYEDDQFPRMFFPKGTPSISTDSSSLNRHYTQFPLKGVFLPIPTSFDGKTVWNLLNEYLNPAINEMYTAMKFTPSGRVMPTLIIRQYPFSSPILNQQLGDKVTAFHELPRWVADPCLVRGIDIGRSDGERTNFVHIYAQPSKKTLISDIAQQIVNWPPLSDPQDIKRHGLRMHMGTIAAAAVDNKGGGPNEWMTIKSDFLMGQHLMLTGVASLFGVTLPIVPGDNFEFDNTLFHIEAVNHHCEVTESGKTFTTQLHLSHGMRADVPKAVAKIPTKRVKKKGHVREDMINLGESVINDPNNKSFAEVQNQLGQYGGFEAHTKALTELQDGIEIDIIAGEQQNLDLYLYSGIDAEDNAERDPGLTIEADPEANK